MAGYPTLLEFQFMTADRPQFALGTGTEISDIRIRFTKWVIESRLVRACEEGEDYRFGFNGMEKDNEPKGLGNSLNFGARMLDTRLGRWLSRDNLSHLYPGVSDYTFALNSPIQGKDPDGNVVIFINGQHAGSGGKAAYWAGFDKLAMDRIGDHSARYVDGALGGWKNTGTRAAEGAVLGSRLGGAVGGVGGAAIRVISSSNVSMKTRIAAGERQGMKDAASIIANLSEGESIKVVTHSMGTGFSRGYVDGIMKYAKEHGLADKVKFDYQLDVNAFQGGSLPAKGKGVIPRTENMTGGLDGGKSWKQALIGNSVPSVEAVPGARDITADEDMDKGHAIGKMSTDNIEYIGNPGTETKRPIEQGVNNGN